MAKSCPKNDEGFCIIFSNTALHSKMLGRVAPEWYLRDSAIKTYGIKQLDNLRDELGL